ncbi:hypothetical protein KKB18_00485, partial [bacterium]|nr:hypothetical protein [bacterium]
MKKKLEKIFKMLIFGEDDINIPVGIDINKQFQPEQLGYKDITRNINSAFLIALSGEEHPLYNYAVNYLDKIKSDNKWCDHVNFYKMGLKFIFEELLERCTEDENFKHKIEELYAWVSNPFNLSDTSNTIKKVQQVFFPEGVGIFDQRDEMCSMLREKRRITITKLNENPIKNPPAELLFTSNVLLTIPPDSENIDDLQINRSMKEQLKQIIDEKQAYWYDHPINIGVNIDQNEVIYGLKGLDEAIEYEIENGYLNLTQKIDILLSLSVTHVGLLNISRDYLEDELKKSSSFSHLNIYIITESEAKKLVKEILIPSAKKYLDKDGVEFLYEIIGVDGMYGKHYSFLKAVSAYWQVMIAPGIKGSFKIDLDQVFPQKELVKYCGSPAFENFKTALWGAEGIDSDENSVELGMIAGSLVNKEDIDKSLFTPDVDFPMEGGIGDELFFHSKLPQALSTEAEMMVRYDGIKFDGAKSCIQRYHVTGGTTGILVDALRKYRPFTPTFIGRAEDQAYIMSVLFKEKQKNLRYLHKFGLIMSHDKETFAQDAIKTASLGKIVGDYLRILLFSSYASALPWSLNRIKGEIDPFTGCFVSRIPFSVVYLRLVFKAASYFSKGKEVDIDNGIKLVGLGINQISKFI